jgi:hypothetical protein
MQARVMPEKKGGFLCLISIGYEDKLWSNRRVCKRLPIFMVQGTPLNGKGLHTSNMLN